MILSKAVESYIRHKRSLGMGFRGEEVRLRSFVRAVGDRDMIVRKFHDGNGRITSFWFSEYYTLTAFYRYALAREYCSKCPLPINIPNESAKFQPPDCYSQGICWWHTGPRTARALFSVFSDPGKFYVADPYTFLFASAMVVVFGAGLFSVDAWLVKRCRAWIVRQ